LQQIVRHYTRESGVRNLEREIANISRKVARKVVEQAAGGEKAGPAGVRITGENVPDYLGVIKFRDLGAEKKNEVGLAMGLAWTEVGGQVMGTEVSLMEGKGRLTLTGQLGDVMQESAQAAMSYVRSRSAQFGLSRDFYRRMDIHVHVPEGAIPKDGPSAGITIGTAIASALMGRPVRCDVAMTGEITLRGKVLPIGGVKEKLLAAHRTGLYTVVLPRDNEKDLAEVPQEIQAAMTIKFVETMDDVLAVALERSLPAAAEAPVPEVAPAFEPTVGSDKELAN
jgi:ATP-dependent Lon protease